MSPSLVIKLNVNANENNETAFVAHDDWNNFKLSIIAEIDKDARE